MGTGSALFILAMVGATVCPCGAATLVNTDFATGAPRWALNGDTRLLSIDGRQILSLTQNEDSQASAAWTELKRRVPSFSFIADLRIRFHPKYGGGDCPADGATLAFAPAETDAVGGAGGELGLASGPIETFTCFEINTWHGQGLAQIGDCTTGRHVTFAFDVINPDVEESNRTLGRKGTPEKEGFKIGQTLPPPGMTLVNGGWYRYQWNADGATNTMTVYVTGLEERNKQFRNVEVLKVTFARNPIDFEGRFGLTAATGGAVEHVDVARVRVEAPMIPPP
jgi:Bacterial lectin